MDITQGREVLPTTVKPVNYNVELEPDFESFTYKGKVTIAYVAVGVSGLASHLRMLILLPRRLKIIEDTKDICVNSLEIEIGDVQLDIGGKAVSPTTKRWDLRVYV